MSNTEIQEDYKTNKEFEDGFDGDSDEEGDYEFSTDEILEEIKDEMSLQSELLERLVDAQEARLEQEKSFQAQLIAALEKIANK